jgi:CheY-like chemotaxis protein
VGYAEGLLAGDSLGPAEAHRVRGILRNAERCVRIVKNLLDRMRRFEDRFVPVELNEVVVGGLDLLSDEMRSAGVDLRTDLAQGSTAVNGNAIELEQVFVNLVRNACDVSAGRGPVTVSTRTTAREVALAVSDSGPGIPPDLVGQIFTPFFTTKSRWGTGLGLAIVKAIVDRHSGRIEVVSGAGGGSTFTITFSAYAFAKPKPQPEGTRPQGLRVLMVDPDEDLAEAVARALEGLGHCVEVATSYERALERLGPGSHDLVMLDGDLDAQASGALLAQVLDSDPSLMVLLMSQAPAPSPAQTFAHRGRVKVLTKPFLTPDLLRVLATIRPGES